MLKWVNKESQSNDVNDDLDDERALFQVISTNVDISERRVQTASPFEEGESYLDYVNRLGRRLLEGEAIGSIIAQLSLSILVTKSSDPNETDINVLWWLCDYAINNRKYQIIDEVFNCFGNQFTVEHLRAIATNGAKKGCKVLSMVAVSALHGHTTSMLSVIKNNGMQLTLADLRHSLYDKAQTNFLWCLGQIAGLHSIISHDESLQTINHYWNHLIHHVIEVEDLCFETKSPQAGSSLLWLLVLADFNGNSFPLQLVWQKWGKRNFLNPDLQIPVRTWRTRPLEGSNKNKSILYLVAAKSAKEPRSARGFLYEFWKIYGQYFSSKELACLAEGVSVIGLLVFQAVNDPQIQAIVESIVNDKPSLLNSKMLKMKRDPSSLSIAQLLQSAGIWGNNLIAKIQQQNRPFENFANLLDLITYRIFNCNLQQPYRSLIQDIFLSINKDYAGKAEELFFHSLYLYYKILSKLKLQSAADQEPCQEVLFDAALGAINLSAKSVLARQQYSLYFFKNTLKEVFEIHNPPAGFQQYKDEKKLSQLEGFYFSLVNFDCGVLIFSEENGQSMFKDLTASISKYIDLKITPQTNNYYEKWIIADIMQKLPLLCGVNHALKNVADQLTTLNAKEADPAKRGAKVYISLQKPEMGRKMLDASSVSNVVMGKSLIR